MRQFVLLLVALFSVSASAAVKLPDQGKTKAFRGRVTVTSPIRVPGMPSTMQANLRAQVTPLANGQVRFQSELSGLPVGGAQTLDVIGTLVRETPTELEIHFGDGAYRTALEASINQGIRGLPMVGSTHIPLTSASAVTKLRLGATTVDVDTTATMQLQRTGGFLLKQLIPRGPVTMAFTGQLTEE